MPPRCESCGYVLNAEEFPRLMGVEAVCPRCRSPVKLPASTMPFIQAAGMRTLDHDGDSGGGLSADKRYAVLVIEGAARGQVFPIEKPRVTIGRKGCDVNLNDPQISRQHALLTIHALQATLEDLGSTNGTFVGESRIDQTSLEDRSEFRVGNHQIMFVVSDRDSEAGPL